MTDGAKAWELIVDVAGRTVTCGEITVAVPQTPWVSDAVRIILDASVIETFIVGREALTSRVYNVAPGKTTLQIESLNAASIAGASIAVKHWALQAISPDRLTT